MALNDFYQGTTKKFNIQISYNGTTPNILSDQVWLYMKNKSTDTTYILSQSADVTTSGSLGVAMFNLTPSMTNIETKIYEYELFWSTSLSEEHVLLRSNINVKSRIKNQ